MADQVRIFVSHHRSPQEDAFAARLAADLKATGADVWLDTESIASGDFVTKISEGLAGRQWLVLVMTPDALRSSWVRQEVDTAFNEVTAHRMLGIIPLEMMPCDVSDIPLLWRSLHRYDATKDYQSALAGLMRALGLAAAPVSQSAPVVPPPLSPASTVPARDPTPAPVGATPALHLTPTTLYNLGFRGYSLRGVEFVLPPVCSVPAGVFTMGSDKTRDPKAKDDELPRHSVQVDAFALGQHPVTVAEYACAVRAKAVSPRIPKTGISWAVRLMGKYEKLSISWTQQLYRLDHPVIMVPWNDALAYTQWLARITLQDWRLPTEAEWEKAARGTDGRIYPWGDAFDSARCNTREGNFFPIDSHVAFTTAVGRYPSGASPYEVFDMAGNVLQWTSSQYIPYPYKEHDGREDVKVDSDRILRGGGSFGYAPDVRAASREHISPTAILPSGFRLAWSPTSTT
jgi:formylglycine-generating enzyme required for sulfatase activity